MIIRIKRCKECKKISLIKHEDGLCDSCFIKECTKGLEAAKKKLIDFLKI